MRRWHIPVFLLLAACSKQERSEDVASAARTARSFAGQAQLALELHQSGKTRPTFDTIYFHYLAEQIETELESESSMHAPSDSAKQALVVSSLRAMDSLVSHVAAHLRDSTQIVSSGNALARIGYQLLPDTSSR
jgi:hypothetical protein